MGTGGDTAPPSELQGTHWDCRLFFSVYSLLLSAYSPRRLAVGTYGCTKVRLLTLLTLLKGVKVCTANSLFANPLHTQNHENNGNIVEGPGPLSE